jgi:hypothetical protein
VALGKPKSDSTRGDAIPALGGTNAGCARVANILRRRPRYRLVVRSANLLQVVPLQEIRKKAVAWDQWEHRNSVLHDHDSTKQHTILTQDTDRLISRQFAMGVQGLPSNNHYLFQEPMEELLKAQLQVRKQWLVSAQSARERRKRRVAEQAEKYPGERQFMTNWLLEGTG